ncbi:protein of unknown function (plasmid) [Caballeronia sp. S22]
MHMEMFSAAQDHHRSLYHYQSIDGNDRLGWLAQTLEYRTIRMSQPSRFNDPWDCKPWFDLSLLDDPEEREKHLQWLARTATISPEGIEEMRADRRKLAAAIEFLHVGHVQAITDMYRVYCLSPNPNQPLLWARYGDSHKGIALEFDARHEQMQWAFRVHFRET